MKLFFTTMLCVVLSASCISQCPTAGVSCTNSANSGIISSLTSSSVICIIGGTATIDGNIPLGAKVYIYSAATLNLQNTNVFEGTIYNCGTFNQGNNNIGGGAFTLNNYGTANLSANGITMGSGDIINNYYGATINMPGNLMMDMNAKLHNEGIITQNNAGSSVNIKSGAELINLAGANLTTAGNFTVESGGKADNYGLLVAHKDININSGSFVYNQCTFHSYTKIIIATSLINDGLLLCDDPAITSPGPGMEKIEINGAATLTNNKTIVGSEFLNSGMVTGNNGRFYFSNITTNSSSSANFNGTNLIFYDASNSGNVLDNGAAGTGVSSVYFALPAANLLTSGCGNIYNVLPLKLIRFNAIAGDNYNVIISWEVDNESTSGNYEIERSNNGISFSKAASITSAENKIEKVLPAELQYSKTIYYRLKMTDASGIVSYSKIVPVQLKNTAKIITSFYPNPVADNLYITSTAAAYTMDIFTANGLQIKSIRMENAGRFSIDLSKEAKGFYFIKFTYSDGSVVNQKIVKQ
jgi:hypothetical protein